MNKTEAFGYIYLIESKIDNKLYIGQSTNLKNKENYFGSGVWIKRAIRKHGKNNFIKTILKECYSFEELNNEEIFFIEIFKRHL